MSDEKPEDRTIVRPSVVRSLVTIAIFTAASGAGSLIKLPAGVGSVALDSTFGFFCAGFFSPLIGGIVGTLGHLASAATAGFPLGPFHFIIAGQMFAWCWFFGFIVRKINRTWGLAVASAVAIILNGIASPLMLIPISPPEMKGVLLGLIGFLVVAATINVVLAAIAILVLSKLDVPGI
jgi:uncharacterized membrane protein